MKDLAILISDLHLDAHTAGVSRSADVCACLGEVGEFYHSFKREKPTVIFAGDLCDPGERSHHALSLFGQWLQSLGKCDDYAINGNHDVVEDGSGASVLSGIDSYRDGGLLVSEADYIEIADGVIVRFLPFAPRSEAYDPIGVVDSWSDEVSPTIVIGHLNHEGMTHGSETDDMPRGREVFWPLEKLKDKFPNALLVGGHYHGQQDKDGVHFIGAPGDFSFSDERKPGALPPSYSVIYEDDGKIGIRRVPFKNARQVKTVRKVPTNIGELELRPNAIVRLKLDGVPESTVADLAHELRQRVDQVVVAGQGVPQYVPVTDPDEQAEREEISARDAAIRAAREFPALEQQVKEDLEAIVVALGG